MRIRPYVQWSLAAALLLGGAGCSGVPTRIARAQAEQSSAAGSADLRTAIRQVSDQVRPAIVQITNLQQQPGQLATGVAVPSGVGSGVIYDAQAHILRWLVGPR